VEYHVECGVISGVIAGNSIARDYPRLFSPDVTDRFLRAVLAFDAYENSSDAKRRARLNCCPTIVHRAPSRRDKILDAHGQRFTAFLQRVFMD